LQQLEAFPEKALDTTKLLFINFGEKEEEHCLKLAEAIRKNGINTEIYPSNDKMKKQMGYADKKNIQFVALVGEQEIADNTISLKDMSTGDQKIVNIDQLIETLK
ncbi:MAG: histidine--tRNA ligase, partial [Bacteroidales bacterium]|nr:histidine--tRNA ligase [Bacteroidales bacterium]